MSLPQCLVENNCTAVLGGGRGGVVRLHQKKRLGHRRHFPRSSQVDACVPGVPKSFGQVRPVLLPVTAAAGEKRTPDRSDSRAMGSIAETETGI